MLVSLHGFEVCNSVSSTYSQQHPIKHHQGDLEHTDTHKHEGTADWFSCGSMHHFEGFQKVLKPAETSHLVPLAPHWSDRGPAVRFRVKLLHSAELQQQLVPPPRHIQAVQEHGAARVLSCRQQGRAHGPAAVQWAVALHCAGGGSRVRGCVSV